MAMSTITRCIPYPDGTSLRDDPEALHALAAEHGVVVMRGIVDTTALRSLRAELLTLASSWLDHDDVVKPGVCVREGGDVAWETWYDGVQRLRSFHAIPHQPRLLQAVQAIVGGEVLVHPRNIARAVGPGTAQFTTPPHQDHWYIGGTPDVWTAWVPVGDCPEEFGGLAVLPGSHRAGLLPRRPAHGAGGSGVDAELGDTWAWEPLAAGDALLFHSLTVHQARDHQSPRMRLSLDMRFQRQCDPVRADSLEPHYGRHTWEEFNADWPVGDPLRRYWERQALTIV